MLAKLEVAGQRNECIGDKARDYKALSARSQCACTELYLPQYLVHVWHQLGTADMNQSRRKMQ